MQAWADLVFVVKVGTFVLTNIFAVFQMHLITTYVAHYLSAF